MLWRLLIHRLWRAVHLEQLSETTTQPIAEPERGVLPGAGGGDAGRRAVLALAGVLELGSSVRAGGRAGGM